MAPTTPGEGGPGADTGVGLERPSTPTRAVEWLRGRLATTEVDRVVAAHSMTVLATWARSGAVDPAEAAALCEVQLAHRSASVRRKAAAHLERG